MSMELSNYLVSWVVTYLGDLQPTYIGVIIYLLSTMDILVFNSFDPKQRPKPRAMDKGKLHEGPSENPGRGRSHA